MANRFVIIARSKAVPISDFLGCSCLGSVGEWTDWLGRTMKRTKKRQTAVLTLSVLALMLIAPWGFGQDPDPLTELRRQAEQGDAEAQNNLGLMYYTGRGVPQDYQEAGSWFRKAAEQGFAEAQYFLGNIYAEGLGVPRNYQEAESWFRKVAEQGFARAQHYLGRMYTEGWGVPQDYQEAVSWYRKSAEQGFAFAQYYLGLMYVKGEGVPQDDVQAHKWLNLAASRTKENAEDLRLARDSLAEKMPASQVAEAQRLAREWQPKTWEQLKDK